MPVQPRWTPEPLPSVHQGVQEWSQVGPLRGMGTGDKLACSNLLSRALWDQDRVRYGEAGGQIKTFQPGLGQKEPWWLLQAVAIVLIWGSLFLHHHVLNGLWSQGALLFSPQTDGYGFRCLGRGLGGAGGGCLLN